MYTKNKTSDVDISLLNKIPYLEKATKKLDFKTRFLNTILVCILYAIAARVKLIGASFLVGSSSRFSLAMTHEGSIISVGRTVSLWASLIINLIIENKVIDLGSLGRRKESNTISKITHAFTTLCLLVFCVSKTRQIMSPSSNRWYVYSSSYWMYPLLYTQLVIGGLIIIAGQQIQTHYGLRSIKYHMIVDSGKAFWKWARNYATSELESGFAPEFTIFFTSIVVSIVFLLFKKARYIELQYSGVNHSLYRHKIPFMFGDTNALLILSTFKEGILRGLYFLQNLTRVPIQKVIPSIARFLKSNEPFYFYYMSRDYWLILAEFIYITIVFFLINYIWLTVSNIGGPAELIKQLSAAKLKPVGMRAGHTAWQQNMLSTMYRIYFLDSIFLYMLVLGSNLFSLIGPSNNTSFVIFLISIMQLWQEIKNEQWIHKYRFLKLRLFEYI